jgi:hypothetical protein
MIQGHIDGMIKAKNQIVEGFAAAPYMRTLLIAA